MIYRVTNADSLEYLRTQPDNSYDWSLCDPPYGFGFMSKKWDTTVPEAALWREVYRTLKPGAHLLAFGGPRTYHRLAIAIEEAGFEIRDCISWIFGSGMPESTNISKLIDKRAGAVREVVGTWKPTGSARPEKGGKSPANKRPNSGDLEYDEAELPITVGATPLAKAFDGYGTGLKPSVEMICVARKPIDGTLAENAETWGTGGLNISECRIGEFKDHNGATGRWPGNVILDEDAGALLDAQTGDRPSTLTGRADPSRSHANPANPDIERDSMFGKGKAVGAVYADSGGASRFFYSAKVSRREREVGCDALPRRSPSETVDREHDSAVIENPRAGAGRTCKGVANQHPTLKPIALTTYLAKLILQPARGRMLCPFGGAGSEAIGACLAGWTFVDVIEREAEYIPIIEARMAHWTREIQMGLTGQ